MASFTKQRSLGRNTNPRSVYDSGILNSAYGGTSQSNIQGLTKECIDDVSTGEHQGEAASWVGGINMSYAIGGTMKWAKESNELCCTDTILSPGGPDALQEKLIDEEYYDDFCQCLRSRSLKVRRYSSGLSASLRWMKPRFDRCSLTKIQEGTDWPSGKILWLAY